MLSKINEQIVNSELSQAAQEILESRRDRREEKLSRREETYTRLRDKHTDLSNAHYERSSQIADAIPFGQPILVGHHSERRHRSDIAKIDSNMRKSVEHQKTAEYYAGRLAAMEGNEAISSDDPDAIAKLEAKLILKQEYQKLMVTANKIIRSKKFTDEVKVEKLGELGIGETRARNLLIPDFAQRSGFADYQLQNNNGVIRQVKARIAELTKKLEQATLAPIEEQEYPELGLTLVLNREIDRLQLVFQGKPNESVRSLLKSRGFKWSPSESAWQRQLNGNAEYAAKCVIEEMKTQ